QSIAMENSILFSEEIQDKIKNIPKFSSVCLGSFEFKNVEKPIVVFALANEGLIVPSRKVMDGKLKKKKTMPRWMQFFFSGQKEI
ncbi:MAG: hypothetical protein M3O67_07060, partial [Bacteroidota bacterium]|nr:hypothetical protein [Bacteroidota bacterium]